MGYEAGLILALLKKAIDQALVDEEAFIRQLEALVEWYRAEPRQAGELKAYVIAIITNHQK